MKRMRLSLDDARFIAAAYADIFDYPLTEDEIRVWLPFRFMRQEKIFKIKAARAVWCKEKWERAKKVAAMLRFIPTIELIGVTGGLAMNNAKKEDDIDLFFISSRGTVWATRLLATCMAGCLGVRRKPGDEHVRNKICLNMFMACDALPLPKNERDFFSAHEVLQMVPLWERGGTYGKFLAANRWVKKFLPNAWLLLSLRAKRSNLFNQGITTSPVAPRNDRKKGFFLDFGIWSLRFFEPLARNIQLWYMKKRRTNEVISDSVIRFHPHDARVRVKGALARRLAKRNIPLDKIFYGR